MQRRVLLTFLFQLCCSAIWILCAGWETVCAQTPLNIHPSFSTAGIGYESSFDPLALHMAHPRPSFEFLPQEILFPAYLAGPKESRLGTQIVGVQEDGALWDSTVGGRFGWFRKTSHDGSRVWQVDVEGAAILRLDPEENIDLHTSDFRAGVPLAMASGPHRFKFAYEHISAHIGDEYLLKNPSFQRLNYARDSLVFGYARHLSERTRVYGEASWAFYHDVSDPWQFQFGWEYAPTRATSILGEPFVAINALLREEVDFGGTTTLHAGWAWREPQAGRLLRTGFFLQTGKTHHYEFFDQSETQIGAGVWYDF